MVWRPLRHDRILQCRESLCALCALSLVFGIAGCKEREVVNNGVDGMYNLRAVAKAYTTTAMRVGPPTKVEDIVPALKAIGDPQELLLSPRDGEQYIIVWGINVARPTSGRGGMTGDLPIIAYEQKGRDGKRQAIDLGMRLKEYTADELAKLVPPGVGPPSRTGD